VYEYVLGEEKYTFVEDVVNPRSCTVLVSVRTRTLCGRDVWCRCEARPSIISRS
jgi:hypothetical protein